MAAALIDVVAVAAFVAIGRRNHEDGVTFAGVLGTAWPFLAGLAIGWVGVRAWRKPRSVMTGSIIWVATVFAGMLLRRFVAGDGTALSFIIVATLFNAVTLVGWRAAWQLASGERGTARGAGS